MTIGLHDFIDALAYISIENCQECITFPNCHTNNWDDDDEYTNGDYTVIITYSPSEDVFNIEVEEMRGIWYGCVANYTDLKMVANMIEDEINDEMNCEFDYEYFDFE